MIRGRALLRSFLVRARGPAAGLVFAAGAAGAGVAAAFVAHRFLIAPDTGRADLLGGLFKEYPHTARFVIGIGFAFRLAADVAADTRSGWTQQLLAAGAARDRYLAALALASAIAAATLYAVTVGTWGMGMALLGHGADPGLHFLRLLPVSLLWLGAAVCFAAAALGITAHGSGAQGLMALLLVTPWAVILSVGKRLEEDPPLWLAAVFRLAPPVGVQPTLRSASMILLFTGSAALVGWLLSHRLLRVRS